MTTVGKTTIDPEPDLAGGPRIAPLVLMMVALFAVLIVAGLALVEQIRQIEVHGAGAAWAEEFIRTNRILLLSLGITSFLCMLLLALFLLSVRRWLEGRSAADFRAETRTAGLAAELNDERIQWKSILGVLQDAVIYSEGDQVRFANRALSRLTGYTPEDVVNDLPSGLEPIREAIHETVQQGEAMQGVYRIQRKDGSEMDVGVIGAPVSGSNGHGPRVVTILRDNSHERTFQTQKRRFVSNASHELRSPVAAIRQRIDLARKQPEKLEEHLQVMENVTIYMRQLIEDMLDVARFDKGIMLLEREDALLEKLVSDAAKPYQAKAERRDIQLNLDLPTRQHRVYADRKRLTQVFTNLISHAMNHTSEGGRVDVGVTNGGDYVCVEVRNNGTSLDPEVLEQLFAPFAVPSTGQEMIGATTILGLSLVKEIVVMHGGDISAESEPGAGTTFRVKLPTADVS